MIRLAEASDLPALREVFRRSAMSNDDDRALLVTHPELQVLGDAGVAEGRTRVALVGDRVVGFASTVVGQSAVELEDLFVDPDWMRQGIGRALMAAIVAAVEAAGGDAIEVDANRHALAFYRPVGFVELGEVPVEYGTAIRMRLAIGGHRVHDGGVRVPRASRPHMPGYGILPHDEGTGLLPWSWASERLLHSHDYWLATISADGRPHVMPVWAVWADGTLWSSSALGSRKARNIAQDGRCTITTDDALEPVVVEGHAEIEQSAGAIGAFLEAMNAKYGTSYEPSFLDPDINATVRITPEVVFGLTEQDFAGSPTRWTFD